MHYILFVVDCLISKPQTYVRMCTSGKENNMLTASLKNLFFLPHLCCKSSSLHSIVLTVLHRRVVAFSLSRQRPQTVWYLRYKHTHLQITIKPMESMSMFAILILNRVRVSTDHAVSPSFLRIELEQNLLSSNAGVQWGELFLAGDGDDQQEQDCR